jgi:hypothetical protein
MRKRNVLESPRLSELKKKRKKDFLKKLSFYIFGLTVIFLFSIYFSRLEKLNITEITVNGNDTLDTEMIKDIVSKSISGKYLGLFPKSNILYYPKGNIRENLSNNFKRLKDIRFSVEKNKILVVSLSEREAKYMWCGDTPTDVGLLQGRIPTSAESEKCYFLDRDGYVFDEAPYFSGEVYFRFFGSLDTDKNYFLKENLSKLIEFRDAIIDMGMKPVAMHAEESGDVKVYLSKGISAGIEPKVIFRLDGDLQNIIENLKTALDTEPLKSKFKTKYSSLLYIDLRFENKVYNKFSM